MLQIIKKWNFISTVFFVEKLQKKKVSYMVKRQDELRHIFVMDQKNVQEMSSNLLQFISIIEFFFDHHHLQLQGGWGSLILLM